MDIWEVLLIAIGLSIDVFVVTAYMGAGFSKINKKNLCCLCLLFSGMQFFAMAIGNLITLIPMFWKDHSERYTDRWELFSVLIFAGLGIYMLVKGIREETVLEKRCDTINWKATAGLSVVTSIDALLAGVGIGILDTQVIVEELLMFPVTVIQVSFGVYIGYMLGLQHNKKAYWVGGALLFLAAVDIVIHFGI